MSNSPVPQAPSMHDAPGADQSWDSLFSNEPELINPAAPTPPAPADPSAVLPPQAAPVPLADEFFLDAGTSKYKTKEEATKGYREKDDAITRLRQYAIEKTGFDPLTGKAVPNEPAPQEPVNYSKDGKRYVLDLAKALSSGREEDYAKIQAQFSREIIEEAIGPYLPIVQEAGKVRAVDTLAQTTPGIRDFLRSDDYKKVLDTFPDIKVSIEQAERTPQGAQALPRFYNIAYMTSLGLKAQSAPPALPVASNTGTPVPALQPRPTTPGSTMTPLPPPTGQPQTPDMLLRNTQGRKQLIQDYESRGVADIKF